MAELSPGGSLDERLARVRARIAAAAERGGRAPEDVTLVAVTKTHPIDVVLQAGAAGILDLGENRAQELRDKAGATGSDRAVRWHFIGHLQTNKVRMVTGTAVLIHSVDTFGLAEAIGRRAGHLGIVQKVLIQVDLGGESSKQGVEPERAVAVATEVAGLDGIAVKGLMTIPPIPGEPEDSRAYFRQLADLSRMVQEAVPGAGELSMGMTRDFEVAIEEGATLVRVGEAIFGPRPSLA